jgi:hypothetical protein
MRTILHVVLGVLLTTVGCSGGGTGGGTQPEATETAGSSLRPEDIKPVTDPTIVTWMAFREGKGTGLGGSADIGHKTTEMSLINVAHPNSRKAIPIDRIVKVLSNEQMGLLIALLEEKGFYRYATAAHTPESVPRRSGNGIIVVERAGSRKGLLFQRGMSASRSAVPGVYVECKKMIMGIFNKADQPQVYTSEQERVLEIDPRLPSDGVRR